jgi:adenylate kinase family enzyme
VGLANRLTIGLRLTRRTALLTHALGDKSMLQRIHIIGGPGSGKSYAARHLSHRLGVPAYDLDDLFWDRAAESYGVRASDTERDAKLMSITDEAAWIIEGVYYRWLTPSFERADVIFVLHPKVFLRDWRILKRFVSRKLGIMPTKRESLLDLYRLIQWNHKYDSDNLKRAMDFIRDFEHKVVTCRCADDLLTRVAKESPNNALERTAEKPAVRSA